MGKHAKTILQTTGCAINLCLTQPNFEIPPGILPRILRNRAKPLKTVRNNFPVQPECGTAMPAGTGDERPEGSEGTIIRLCENPVRFE